jgi:putative alpha-1,2-mannosidase
MSAWYVFSALGFYPVNPVNGDYIFGSPLIDKAIIKLDNGKKFSIEARNNSADNIYIHSAELNGKKIDKPVVRYQDVVRGGSLIFNMSNSH